jgi:hypothetical protein
VNHIVLSILGEFMQKMPMFDERKDQRDLQVRVDLISEQRHGLMKSGES